MGMEFMPKRYSTSEGPGLSMKFSAAIRASSCLMGIFLWTERIPGKKIGGNVRCNRFYVESGVIGESRIYIG